MDLELAIFYCVICITWIEYLWELYLSLRQHKVYERAQDVPPELDGVISKETFEKSRKYGLDRSTFSFMKKFYEVIISTIMIWFFFIRHVWTLSEYVVTYFGFENGEILQSAVYVFICNTVNIVLSMPFSVYSTFVVEEMHGFNKQTAAFFVKDKLKAYLVTQLLVIPITCACVYIVRVGGDYFFLYLWVFTMAMSLFFMTVYPDYIAPLFDKYTPLPEGSLRSQIEALAASIQFPLYKLYVVEGSKRSVHSNAYFYGFFKNKRIVLYDTLVKGYVKEEKKEGAGDEEEKGCDDDEVLAVLSHELGHWKSNHVAKHIVIIQVNLLLQFMAFGYLFKYPLLYRAFGFYDEQPIVIGSILIFLYVFFLYNSILSFLLTMLSRKFEFEADRFAMTLHKAEALGRALIKLHKDNLSFPIHDWLFSAWHHSHPTLLQRLAILKKTD